MTSLPPPQPPPLPEGERMLPDDPDRWERGDWAFDAEKDAAWENPEILRRRIGTLEELEAVADAIVRGHELTATDPEGNERVIVGGVGETGNWSHGLGEHVVVENLKALIEAVQAHPTVRLAKVEAELDKNGHLRVLRRWVENSNGTELEEDAEPTELRLWHNVVAAVCKEGEDYGGLDIGVTLRPEARFAGDADFQGARFDGDANFYGTRFTGRVDFIGARFAGDANFIATHLSSVDFSEARFARNAGFCGGHFTGATSFKKTYFTGNVDFSEAHFDGIFSFQEIHFARNVDFSEAHFDGIFSFQEIHFARNADFKEAHFNGNTFFFEIHFAENADFSETRFDGDAGFSKARFDGDAEFIGTRFDRFAIFSGARFAGDARFGGSRFNGDAWFSGARVRRKARLLFVSTHFAQRVRFDGDPESTRPLIRGKVFFTDSTLDERLTFDHTRFGKHARLGFRRFLARGGATIELSEDQLGLTRPQPADQPLLRIVVRPWRWRWMRNYFAFDPSRTIMMGGDGDDPDVENPNDESRAAAMDRAADDYELLAANYARQPATDREEDGCRWMAHELRRRAGWVRTESALREFLRAPFNKSIAGDTDAAATNRLLAGRPEGPLLWYLEYFVLIGSCVLAYTAFAGGIVRDWVWEWGIKRTAVGYLLQPHRTAVSGVLLVLVCAMIYGVFASEHTITAGNTASAIPPWEADGLLGRARFGLYFSLTTFVTLGYGDYAPTGWFKLITGVEGLLGVTLLAIFTVAWGRKMVR